MYSFRANKSQLKPIGNSATTHISFSFYVYDNMTTHISFSFYVYDKLIYHSLSMCTTNSYIEFVIFRFIELREEFIYSFGKHFGPEIFEEHIMSRRTKYIRGALLNSYPGLDSIRKG
jgi:hypothetical protein